MLTLKTKYDLPFLVICIIISDDLPTMLCSISFCFVQMNNQPPLLSLIVVNSLCSATSSARLSARLPALLGFGICFKKFDEEKEEKKNEEMYSRNLE